MPIVNKIVGAPLSNEAMAKVADGIKTAANNGAKYSFRTVNLDTIDFGEAAKKTSIGKKVVGAVKEVGKKALNGVKEFFKNTGVGKVLTKAKDAVVGKAKALKAGLAADAALLRTSKPVQFVKGIAEKAAGIFKKAAV